MEEGAHVLAEVFVVPVDASACLGWSAWSGSSHSGITPGDDRRPVSLRDQVQGTANP